MRNSLKFSISFKYSIFRIDEILYDSECRFVPPQKSRVGRCDHSPFNDKGHKPKIGPDSGFI